MAGALKPKSDWGCWVSTSQLLAEIWHPTEAECAAVDVNCGPPGFTYDVHRNHPCPSCGFTVWGGCACLTRYSANTAEADTLPGVQAPTKPAICPCGIDRRDCEYHR